MGFAAQLTAAAERTDGALDAALAGLSADGRAPERLIAATRHALLGGGKRFRPFLAIECARLFGEDGPAPVTVGAAFECLHAYSLVHDDLPAMDDDDLRRGRPTVHKAFDEATAILVGDGLQSLAFRLLSGPPVPSSAQGPLVRCLAEGAGFAGMVGGQYRDINAAGLDVDGVRQMQSMKTGALIAGACEAGALVAGAPGDEVGRLRQFGAMLGEAFQLADDLLDLEGTEAETGKRVGKDADEGKVTLPELLGLSAAKARVEGLAAAAAETLGPFGAAGDTLRAACRFVVERKG
ncbi:MAG: polyprenyl synthetase family protein [Pseudomonadota bacterium]